MATQYMNKMNHIRSKKFAFGHKSIPIRLYEMHGYYAEGLAGRGGKTLSNGLEVSMYFSSHLLVTKNR